MFLFLTLVYSNIALADEISGATYNGFEEILMGGAGVARLGSRGAVIGNPSLLAWLPSEDKFSALNSLVYVKQDQKGGVELAPTLIPIYAGNTKGDGEIGFGYTLYSSSFKSSGSLTSLVNDNSGLKGKFTGENSTIGLAFGYGKKLTQKLGIGLSVKIQRESSRSTTNYTLNPAPFQIMSYQESDSNISSSLVNLGSSYVLNSGTSFGAVLSTPLAVFENRSRDYVNSITVDESDTVDTIVENKETTQNVVVDRVPEVSFGVREPLGKGYIYYDLVFQPKYNNRTAGGREGRRLSHYFGLEQRLENKKDIFAGITISESVKNDNSFESEPAKYQVSTGFKRYGQHSDQLFGFSWGRSLNRNKDQTFIFSLGTEFKN